MWDLIVLVPDHCLLFYFAAREAFFFFKITFRGKIFLFRLANRNT